MAKLKVLKIEIDAKKFTKGLNKLIKQTKGIKIINKNIKKEIYKILGECDIDVDYGNIKNENEIINKLYKLYINKKG